MVPDMDGHSSLVALFRLTIFFQALAMNGFFEEWRRMKKDDLLICILTLQDYKWITKPSARGTDSACKSSLPPRKVFLTERGPIYSP